MLVNVEPASVGTRILNFIYAYSNGFHAGGSPITHAINLPKVQKFIELRQPIHLILPAFPAKSPNRQKTLGALPDLADLEGLRMLQNLAVKIEEIYSPGARILICADGRVFSDLVRVSDLDVENYKQGIERMIAWHGLNHLATFHLEDVFGALSFEGMRTRLTREFAVPVVDLRGQLHEDASLRFMFNGIHRFMFEDTLVLSPQLSRSQARTRSKALAYQVIQRSDAWSRLLAQKFPSSLRLSIHPQPPQSGKLGVQLVPSPDRWSTPWHNVLVSNGQQKLLMKRRDAEALGAKLQRSPEGYLFYFRASVESLRHAL